PPGPPAGPPGPPPGQVPEPSSLAVLGAAIAALATFGRRRVRR
ncbi:MAG: PEP-CTERM sorting domain-containing protein, partial [Rhodospirillales bacterium]|nr:PEP-CTERM sorting domain-containing protein [Rhodospirillales bacterium]